jgi:chromosome segregation ATPase
MSSDVQQWITEIRSLQQQLQTAQEDRDAAHASADKWRSLYQSEAQQRRTEIELMRDRITELEQALAAATASPALPEARDKTEAPIPNTAVEPPSLDALHQQLQAAQSDLAHLRAALRDERTNHERTRQNLMTALADTMDLLAREKGDRAVGQSTVSPVDTTGDRPAPSNPSTQPTKNPWPELPPLG